MHPDEYRRAQVDDRSDEMYFIGEGRLEVHVPRKPAARARTMRRRRGAAASQQSAAPPSPSPLANAREKVRYSMKKCVSIKEPEEEEEVFVRMGELVVCPASPGPALPISPHLIDY